MCTVIVTYPNATTAQSNFLKLQIKVGVLFLFMRGHVAASLEGTLVQS